MMMSRATLFVLCLAACCTSALAERIRGSGSTFAAALYAGWSDQLKDTKLQIDYEAVGSSAGVKRLLEHGVDFGATDRPLRRDALEQGGLAQFPAAVGGVVIAANVPGIAADRIRLDGKLLADIYLGEVKKWSHPAIAALNADLKLPDLPIALVVRSDGSGT